MDRTISVPACGRRASGRAVGDRYHERSRPNGPGCVCVRGAGAPASGARALRRGAVEAVPQLLPPAGYHHIRRLPRAAQRLAGAGADRVRVLRLLEGEGDSIILAKRTGRCFPPAERQLAEAGLPDDLKFILLVESKCISAAYSRAKASGPWQFVPSTGRLFSLQNNHWKDDRRNLELSTEAAVKFLKRLHDIFGDWFLAIAAYNAGEVHIRKAMREQRVDDYWKLHYATETMRYVPRIIASKEIFSQPDKYLGVAKADLYPPLDTEVVTVNIKEDRRHLAAVAEQFGTYFLELKLLNPEIRKDYLPRGTHQIKIPRRPDNGCPMPCEKADEPH